MKMAITLSVNDQNAVAYAKAFKLGVAKRLASLNTRKVTDLSGEKFSEVPKFPDCGTPEKPVVPSWLEKAPIAVVEDRMAIQSSAKAAYITELLKIGFCEAEKEVKGGTIKGLARDGVFYTFSSVSCKNDDGIAYISDYPLVSTWVEENIKDDDHPIKIALNEYLQTFWLDEDKFFEKLGGKENAVTIMYPCMTLAECQTLQRFLSTIKEVNERQDTNKKEYLFLKQLLSGKGGVSRKELIYMGLLPEDEDHSRDKEVEERKKFFESLSDDQKALWFLTRKVARFLNNYDSGINDILGIRDYRNYCSFEQLVYELKIYEGSPKRNSLGNPVLKNKVPIYINSWTYWELLTPYYVSGIVSCGDLALAFYKFSERAASYGHKPMDQAAFQFESWAKNKLARLKDYVNGIPGDPDHPAHPQSKDFLEAFAERLVEDEIF